MEENNRNTTVPAQNGMGASLPAATVAVVDDDAAARISLVRLLQLEGYTVHEFEAASAFLEAPDATCYSCIVTDLRMPGVTGLDLQKSLEGRGVFVPLVFVTAFGTVPASVQAMRSGAVDFLEKPADPSALLDAVQRAVARRAAHSSKHELLTAVLQRIERLTAREREVFEGVARGLPNKSIATELGIALKTVKVHRGRVMTKMGAESVADLVRAKEILGDK
ncbi:MAG TPA: response regulator [Gemmatimonas sp.]|uniref:response regulator transcription factor n=1 Tax=Gemmatimonas sp. TaxID=1962908 RepID=UPI002ED93D29